MPFDPTTIIMLVVLAVLVFFVFRNSRKRKADAEKIQTQMVPGAEIMTSFGLYGTIIELDDVANTATLEIAPGTAVKVHKQTLSKVVSSDDAPEGAPRSVEEAMAIANREAEEREAAAAASLDAEPAFGERTESEPATDAAAAAKKPARRTTKKPATDGDAS
ncbi:preprotein translocase subunit YajC [Galbitalea sp. SE-J8]|uniref:preprotein translocase subunit YajC n=1 Tax=Galbitalea sp. SE-J8 TaxID=3054952 RepID=UPI00259D1AFE|nr:preprotein translocase subunit YajC [Galbitalea sp. SE-J8]MDM4763238.1 preprotein translocase subunit YajC [Galbitalea sp. SE-J8]